jgi:hypothetical protein
VSDSESGVSDSDSGVEDSEGNESTEESMTPEQKFEDRKKRLGRGELKAPDHDPALGYAPRKLLDTKHWGENKNYFLKEVIDVSGGLDVQTKYYNDEERAQHRVRVNADGLLAAADGSLLDTQKAAKPMAEGAQGGRHIFAMNQADEMYTADAIGECNASVKSINDWAKNGKQGPRPVRHMTHHSSFFAGKSLDQAGNYDFEADEGLKGAGETGVKEGWLQKISNVSGHYLPDMNNTMATVKALEKQGLNTDATKLENIWYDAQKQKHLDTYRVQGLMASGGNLDLLRDRATVMNAIESGIGQQSLRPVRKAQGPADEEWWGQAYRDGDQSAAPKVKRPDADKQSLLEYKAWKASRSNAPADDGREG